MSQYSKSFIRPTVVKIDQKQLKDSGEFEELKLQPVRAALGYQTSSKYYDPMLELFINHIMEMGKKELARSLVEKAFLNIKRRQLERYHLADEEEKPSIELNPREIFHQAVENCRPVLRLMPISRGGQIYQVPCPVDEKRSYFMAMKWLIEAGKDKFRTVHFPEQIAWELMSAAANTGRVVQRKQELHRKCEENRAYAHYRWQ